MKTLGTFRIREEPREIRWSVGNVEQKDIITMNVP